MYDIVDAPAVQTAVTYYRCTVRSVPCSPAPLETNAYIPGTLGLERRDAELGRICRRSGGMLSEPLAGRETVIFPLTILLL